MVIAARGSTPVATAMIYESDGVASVQWVGTIPAARKSGLGALVTTVVTNLAFERDAVLGHAAGLTDGGARLPRARLRDPLHLRRARRLEERLTTRCPALLAQGRSSRPRT